MKVIRGIVEIDEELCDGCGQCIPACPEGAMQIIDGKARLVSEKYCDGLGACLGECPSGAIKIVEREAEDFDPEAVEAYLKSVEEKRSEMLECGCASAGVQTFATFETSEELGQKSCSMLSHWPVQIRLVPKNAPFLKEAELLIAADCTPVVYPNFHQDFLKGKVVMIGCPKFDSIDEYIGKFTEIFKTHNIKGVTCLTMEVPCCSGLPFITRQAMGCSGKKIPMEEIVLSVQGSVKGKSGSAES